MNIARTSRCAAPIALCTCVLLTILTGCQTALPRPEPLALDGVRNLTRAGDIYISGAATPEAIEALKSRGVRTLLDLRLPEQIEPEFAKTVRSLGVTYVPLPMKSVEMTDGQAAAFLEAMRTYAGEPLLIHCKSGNRSGAMYGLYAGAECDLGVDQAIISARQAGMKNDDLAADLRQFLTERASADE